MTIVFASRWHQYPDDYVPPSIEHGNPQVLAMAEILMDADVDANDWHKAIRGATQGSDYHEEPYRREIQRYISMAEEVLNRWGFRPD